MPYANSKPTDSYSLIIIARAKKELRKIPAHFLKKITFRIEQLCDDPRPRQSQKLTGSTNEYRLRVGDYRAIYEVDDKKREITVLHIRHRQEAYQR